MATNTSQNSTLEVSYVTILLLKYFSSTVDILAYSANVPLIKIITPKTAGKKGNNKVSRMLPSSVHNM